MARSTDPEVAALARQVRELTKQAYDLSVDINEKMEELFEFRDGVETHRDSWQDRRRAREPYEGEDRRHG